MVFPSIAPIVLCSLIFISPTNSDEIVDPSGWNLDHDLSEMVDPSGWNYDRETKGFKRPIKIIKSTADQCENLLDECHDIVQNYCDKKLKSVEKASNAIVPEHQNDCDKKLKSVEEISKAPEPVNRGKKSAPTQGAASEYSEINFMKRFINLLLRSAHVSSISIANGGPFSGLVDIRVTEEDLMVLETFGDPEKQISLRQLDTVLSRVINSGLHMSKEYFTWMDNIFFFLSQRGVWLFAGGSCIILFVLWLFLSGHPCSGILFILTVLVLVVSYVMEYYRQIQEAEIKQMMALKKSIPSACQDGVRSWYLDLLALIFRNDCQEYYSATIVNPVVNVSPAKVLGNVFADLVLAPAHKLGEAVAQFTSGLTGNLPFLQGWFILPFVSVGIFVIVFMGVLRLLGGRVRFNSLLFGVEIGGDVHQVQDTPSSALPGGSVKSASNNPSSHHFIEAISSSSRSNLVVMDASSLKELLSQKHLERDINILQHREPIETILSPGPSPMYRNTSSVSGNKKVPEESMLPPAVVQGETGEAARNLLSTGSENYESEAAMIELVSNTDKTEEPELQEKTASALSNLLNDGHERDESKTSVTETVPNTDRTAKHYIYGGGDASSGR